MPFREWNLVFRERNFEFRELLREYPRTLRELLEWPFHSESVFPEIGVVPNLLKNGFSGHCFGTFLLILTVSTKFLDSHGEAKIHVLVIFSPGLKPKIKLASMWGKRLRQSGRPAKRSMFVSLKQGKAMKEVSASTIIQPSAHPHLSKID